MSNKIILELTQDEFAEIISCCDAAHNEFSDEGSLAMSNKLREMDTSPDKVVVPYYLLQELTDSPRNNDRCHFCGGDAVWVNAFSCDYKHEKDCCYVAARKLLGDDFS